MPERSQAEYLSIVELISKIDSPSKKACTKLLENNRNVFENSFGSTHNHQAWEGGYLDHLQESMNIAILLHDPLNSARDLPFTLSDALLVLFLHDLEKPWKYEMGWTS